MKDKATSGPDHARHAVPSPRWRMAWAPGLCLLVSLLGAWSSVRSQSTSPRGVPEVPSLPATIPIFPLGDVVFFPENALPLHIFESRYRAMVADALEGDRIIGMVLLRPGYQADYEGRPPIFSIGCAGVITDVESLPDGRYNILLRGLVKFRIHGEDQRLAYRLAHVEALPEVTDQREQEALRGLRPRLEQLLSLTALAPTPPPPMLSDRHLVNGLSQYLDLPPLVRQDLLERPGLLARSQALIQLLEMILAPAR